MMTILAGLGLLFIGIVVGFLSKSHLIPPPITRRPDEIKKSVEEESSHKTIDELVADSNRLYPSSSTGSDDAS